MTFTEALLQQAKYASYDLYLLLLLIICLIWRQFSGYEKTKWLHWSMIFYTGVFFFEILMILNFMQINWDTDGFTTYKGSDAPEHLQEALVNYTSNASASFDEAILKPYETQAAFSLCPRLIWFVSWSPIGLVLAFLVSAVHCWTELSAMPKFNESPSWTETMKRRRLDYAIIVTIWPVIFSMMSFWMMCHALQTSAYGPLTASYAWGTFDRTKVVFHQAYESAFGLAHAYAALALFFFGRICCLVLDDVTNDNQNKLDGAYKRQPDVDASQTLHKNRDVKDNLIKELSALKHGRMNFVDGGIRWFCICCFLTYFHNMPGPTLVYLDSGSNRWEEAYDSMYPMAKQDYVRICLSGAGFVTSLVTLLNLRSLGKHHNKAFADRQFRPEWKFNNTMWMVTMLFLQGYICNLFKYSLVHRNLLKAYLLCMECFFLTILHFHTWGANEKWLEGVEPLYKEEPAHGHGSPKEPLLPQ